jgi:ABC-type Na+ efflux pump permease subunit
MSRPNQLAFLFALGVVLGVGVLHTDTSIVVPTGILLVIFTLALGCFRLSVRNRDLPKVQQTLSNVIAYNLGLIVASIIVLTIVH